MMWLDAEECLSVSSLEMGSDFEEDDEESLHSHDGSHDGSYDPSSDSASSASSCSHCHAGRCGADEDHTCSEVTEDMEEEEEEEEQPIQPASSPRKQKRYSRQERLKTRQKKQQQESQNLKEQQQQLPPINILPLPPISKRGVSTPDLSRSRWSNSSSDRLDQPSPPPPQPQPTLKNFKSNNSRWNSSSTFVGGAKSKAGWDLLNDARIGMGASQQSLKDKLNISSSSHTNSITTRVLDVSIKHTPSKTKTLQPLAKTTINLTTVTVSINKAVSTPNLGGGAEAEAEQEEQRLKRRSDRRRRRRRRTSTYQSSDDDDSNDDTGPTKPPGHPAAGGGAKAAAFRRCTSDPSSLMKQCRWKDRFSNNQNESGEPSTEGFARRASRSDRRRSSKATSRDSSNSGRNTRWSSASSDDDETPLRNHPAFRRCRSEPSYLLNQNTSDAVKIKKKKASSKNNNDAGDRWKDRFSSDSEGSGNGKGARSGRPQQRVAHNTPTTAPAPPTSTTRLDIQPKIPRASAPNLMSIGTTSRSGNGLVGGGNARWSSSSPSNTRNVVQPSASSGLLSLLNQKRNASMTTGIESGTTQTPLPTTTRPSTMNNNGFGTGVSAPNLLNLLNQKRSGGTTTTNLMGAAGPPAVTARSALLPTATPSTRPGVQRTDSHVMALGRRSKLTNASAPNLINFRRTASVPQPRGAANAQWGGVRSMNRNSNNNNNPLLASASMLGGIGLGSSTAAATRPVTGVSPIDRLKQTNSRMHRSKMTGISAPNLGNLVLQQRAADNVDQFSNGSQNAQWGTSGGNTASSGIVRPIPHRLDPGTGGGGSLHRRGGLGLERGVQRTDSRMGRANKSILLAGASAPNLMNLQQNAATRAPPTTGATVRNNSNAQWNNTAPRPGLTQGLASNGLSLSTSGMNAKLGGGRVNPSLSSFTTAPTRPGVARTTSHMVRGSKLANASAPNLLNFRRTASIPQDRGSANAQWSGGRNPTQGNLNRTPSTGLGGSTMLQQLSGSQRSGSRTALSALMNRDNHVSTPNLSRLNLGRGTNLSGVGTTNSGWEGLSNSSNPTTASVLGPMSEGLKSTLLRASSNTRQGRGIAGAKHRGLSTPNLLNLSHSSAASSLASSQNTQWASTLPTVSEPSHLLRSPNHPVPSLDHPSVPSHNSEWTTRPSNLNNSKGLRRSITNPNPSPSSRWDSSSAFDLSSLHESTNGRPGEPPKSPPNTGQLLLNRPLLSQRRNGASAPNLLATNLRHSTSERGVRSNTDWSSKRSSRRTTNPVSGQDDALGMTLETLLDLVSSNGRREEGNQQMDQWSTAKMLPKRQKSKSKKKKEKKKRRNSKKKKCRHHQHHDGEEDGVPKQLCRSKTAESDASDASYVPYRRSATAESDTTDATEASYLPYRRSTTAESDTTDATDTPRLPYRRSNTAESDTTDATDTSHLPLRRTATDESMETLEKEEAVDLVSELTGLIASELEDQIGSTTDSVAKAAMSLAALEITRCSRMALRKERSNSNLMDQHELDLGASISNLGCSETIQEHPSYISDDDDDAMSYEHQRNDIKMKAPVRCMSNESEQDFDDMMTGDPSDTAQRRKVDAMVQPQRRASAETIEDTPLRRFLDQQAESGDGAFDFKPTPIPRSTKANRLPERKLSLDSTRSQQSGIMGGSITDDPSICSLSSYTDKDVAPMTSDCSNLDMSLNADSVLHNDNAAEPPSSSMHPASASSICEISDTFSPVDVKKLVAEVGCTSDGGLTQCSASPLSALPKSGSLGSFKAKLGLMPNSEGSKLFDGSSSILGNLSKMNGGATTSSYSCQLSSSQLSSLKAGLATSSKSSSGVSSSQLGYLVKNRSNSLSSPNNNKSPATTPMTKASPFGNIMNDVSKMIQMQSSDQSSQQEKMEVAELPCGINDNAEQRTVTSAGCSTSEA